MKIVLFRLNGCALTHCRYGQLILIIRTMICIPMAASLYRLTCQRSPNHTYTATVKTTTATFYTEVRPACSLNRKTRHPLNRSSIAMKQRISQNSQINRSFRPIRAALWRTLTGEETTRLAEVTLECNISMCT